MNMSESKIEIFFKNLLSRFSSAEREPAKTVEIQKKRLQLLEQAVEEEQYDTIELFFEIIQKKNYSVCERNRAWLFLLIYVLII